MPNVDHARMMTTNGLVYNTAGTPGRPALLFLHGAGVSRWMWMGVIPQLQDDFYCVSVDLPGSGDSAAAPWDTFEDTADQMAALLRDTVPGGQAHVVGFSLGGYVGLHLLARHPEVVASLLVSGVTTQPFTRM